MNSQIIEYATQKEAAITALKSELLVLHSRHNNTDKRIDDIHSAQNKWFTILAFLITAVLIVII